MKQEYKVFLPTSLLAALVSILLFDVVARMMVRAETFSNAINDSVYYSVTQPIGTIMLLFPFLFVGWISAVVSKDAQQWKGWCYFICGVGVLFYLYFAGQMNASYYIEQKQWTASALSVGLLPFYSIPALICAFSIGWISTKVIGRWKT